jgi:putative ABC transport system permease protein
MRLMRDLGRRKLRSTLTITGILIGIMALVVFGSMANKIDALVQGGSDYYRDKIIVGAKGSFMGLGGVLSIHDAEAIAALPGVAVAVPGVAVMLDDQGAGMSLGTPPMITGSLAGADGGRETFALHYASGRALAPADEASNVAVLGSDLARKQGATVGEIIRLRGVDFRVVGILEPTLTAPDNEVMVPLAAAQQLLHASLPPMVARGLQPADLATSIVVYPEPGTDPAALAAVISSAIPDISTMTGADFDQQIGTATTLLNAILVGIALISLIVGGLSVINTMAMSVAERTREIGIKRAVGASRWRIRREIVAESAVIGFIGGALGLLAGGVIVYAGNEAGRTSGTILFDLTASTAVMAVLFAVCLGAIAGFVPAWHASRLDPVTALRYE